MLRGIQIRFQHWIMGSTIILVALLSLAFLSTVFQSFSAISKENAQSRFALIAKHAIGELNNLVQDSGKFINAHAYLDVEQFVQGKRINQQDAIFSLLTSIEADTVLYSHYFGLPNNEFLQVIGIHGDERIIAALKAPLNTHYAIRRILLGPAGKRIEYYHFFSKNRQELGELTQTATYIPTERSWYTRAIEQSALIVTDPYLFFSTGELGITVAAPLPANLGVLATDISLRSLQEFLAGLMLPPNGAIALQDSKGRILAFHGKGVRYQQLNIAPMTAADKINNPYLVVPLNSSGDEFSSKTVNLGPQWQKEAFVVTKSVASLAAGTKFYVIVMAPLSDFSGPFYKARYEVITVSIIVLLILLPLALMGSRQVTNTLMVMAANSEHLKHLDFSHSPENPRTFLYEINTLSDAQYVMHAAILERTSTLVATQSKLENLIQIGFDLGRERDRMMLLRKTLFSGKKLLHCDAGTLYFVTEHQTLSFALRTKDDDLPAFEIPLYDENGAPIERYMATWCALHNKMVVVDDVYHETRFDVSGTKKMDAETGYRTVSMLTLPLSPRAGEVIGVLQFLNALDPETGRPIPFPAETLRFVTALAAQIAIVLDNFQLVEVQNKLLDAIIKLLAGAIDAKSPYTGGHCERVPKLSIMLAEAACAVTVGPLADFKFTTDDEWREFRLGAWLHDCGKITTPEYVVDKASKLETIYNRIHEVRMRFEVLLRDAKISQLETGATGADPVVAFAAYEVRKAQLANDFAFVAECNLGGEFMAVEKAERLQCIARETWLRNYDDRIGLPHEELKRYTANPEVLPAIEHLLADKPHHIIPRNDTRSIDSKWGFKVKVPKYLYNYGEIYNLSIGHGTLTDEERFKINEHVMQSIIMLDQLPLPKVLQRIPEYAGTHHETLIGTGYPRKLTEADLSIPMRIMTIADVFEALTASDRPYKKAKTLSESIKILSFFKKDKHIDPNLFDLFLTSGVYKQYAEKYLKPEQIDEVDISKYLS